MVEIQVWQGDITLLRADVLVNAANQGLRGGGGVDGAIHDAAGPRLAEAGGALAPCPRGEARVTPAFDLDPPVRHIIHTVGPVWRDGAHGEAATLASCYRNSLAAADALGARTVAFPAISTGIYGFPATEAAAIAVGTLRACPTSVRVITLVAYDRAAYAVLSAALETTRA